MEGGLIKAGPPFGAMPVEISGQRWAVIRNGISVFAGRMAFPAAGDPGERFGEKAGWAVARSH
jgi:hypothetical protein